LAEAAAPEQPEDLDDAATVSPTPVKRPRRAAKGKASEPVQVDAVAQVIEATAPIAPPEPAQIVTAEATSGEPAPQSAPSPVTEVVPEIAPEIAPEPDPNEITMAPATPRRGWWRR
jgi:hypothetical protein